jgi:hypothetical protein
MHQKKYCYTVFLKKLGLKIQFDFVLRKQILFFVGFYLASYQIRPRATLGATMLNPGVEPRKTPVHTLNQSALTTLTAIS